MDDRITLTIDGQPVTVKKGSSILEAAESAGIFIPHLCFLHGLRPYVGCRMCVVEIEGARGLELSCAEPARDGMVVHSNTPHVQEMRRGVLEVIISEHPWKCLTCWRRERCDPFETCQREAEVDDRCVWCAKNKDCELQRVCDWVNMRRDEPPFYQPPKSLPLEWSNPFVQFDPNKCIYCTRCVRVCNERRNIAALDLINRGDEAFIGAAFGGDLECEYCGDCAAVCPCAAIMDRPRKFMGAPDRSVASVCAYCGLGCGIQVDVKNPGAYTFFNSGPNGKHAHLFAVDGDPDHPWSRGELCVRGRYGFDFVNSERRVRAPLLRRRPLAGETMSEVTWDEALDVVSGKLADIRERSGSMAIGVVGSSRATNEESYLLQKLARAVLGTNNVDQSLAAYHRPTLDTLHEALGVAAMPGSLDDLEQARCLLVVGNNTNDTHPVAGLAIRNAVRQRGAKLIVAHPLGTTDLNERTTLADMKRWATLWLRYRPGTEAVLLAALAREILVKDLMGAVAVAQEVTDYVSFLAALDPYTPAAAAEHTGVPAADIVKAAALFVGAGAATGGEATEKQAPQPACVVFASGISPWETSRETAQAAVNLVLAAGNLGRPGSGVVALAAENNLQGACDVGVLPDRLPGYQPVDDASVLARFEAAWFGSAGGQLPRTHGMTVGGMLAAARDGRLRALVVLGDDLLTSLPDPDYVRECLGAVEFLVVVDSVLTETARLAHAVLPGATFAEKDGTFTSTERRVQMVRQALLPPDLARPEWQILSDLARRIQEKGGPVAAPFAYEGPAAVMAEIGTLLPAYQGVTYDRLAAGGLQWPCLAATHQGTPRLFADGLRGTRFLVPNGIARGAPAAADGYPYTLVLGRSLFSDVKGQGAASARLSKAFPEEFVLVSKDDARTLGVADGGWLRVVSPHGELRARVRARRNIPSGVVFVPLSHRGSAGRLLDERATVAGVRLEKE